MSEVSFKEPPSSILNINLTNRTEVTVLPIILFTVGIAEYILITFLTDSIAAAKRLAAAISVFFYIILWFLVGREVILGNVSIAIFYAAGCAIGTFLTCKDSSGHSITEKTVERLSSYVKRRKVSPS